MKVKFGLNNSSTLYYFKWIRYALSPILLILISSNPLEAETSRKTTPFVLPKNGEAMTPVKIKLGKKWTNENQVSFIYNKELKTLPAKDVKSYFGTYLVQSISIAADNSHKLASLCVPGNIKMVRSISSEGNPNYFVLINNEWHALENHQWELNKFFEKRLDNFHKSNAALGKKIYYNFKSLANFIASYNQYLNSSLSLGRVYENKSRAIPSIFGALGFLQANIQETEDQFTPTPSFSLGGQVEFKYSRLFSLITQLEYSISNAQSDFTDLSFQSINLNNILAFMIYENKDIFRLSVGPGINANFQVNSKIQRRQITLGEANNVAIKGIKAGVSLSAMIYLKSKIGLSFGFHHFNKMKTQDFSQVTPNSSKNVSANIIRTQINYFF